MVIIGIILVYQQYDILLIIPLFSSAFAFVILYDQRIVLMTHLYLLHIEKNKIPTLIGSFSNERMEEFLQYWMGWEHYWSRYEPEYASITYSFGMLFGLIPFISSMLWSSLSILKLATSNLPNFIHYASFCIDILLVSFLIFKMIALYKLPKIHKKKMMLSKKNDRKARNSK